MEAIMINKFQEGSEAYLMMKREDDVIRARSQAYRWFVEVTGAGMHQLVQNIMFPKGAQRDEDVLRIVEAWMDDYREATSRGMTQMDDMFRMTILKRLVTPRYKERMDPRDLTKFDEAFNEVLKWATVKSRESQDAPRSGNT